MQLKQHCDTDETKKRKYVVPDSKTYEVPSLLWASGRVFCDYLFFYAVLKTTALVEQGTKSAWQLQAVHTMTWLCSSIFFINSCYSFWAVIGAIGQKVRPAEPPELFHMDHYNPSPWGPFGAAIEYGLAGKPIPGFS